MAKVLFQILFCLQLEKNYINDIMLQTIMNMITKRPLPC